LIRQLSKLRSINLVRRLQQLLGSAPNLALAHGQPVTSAPAAGRLKPPAFRRAEVLAVLLGQLILQVFLGTLEVILRSHESSRPLNMSSASKPA
jgi:hypothetical protein